MAIYPSLPFSGNKDSDARSVGARTPVPASLSNRRGPEDWPPRRGSSRATRCWTATGSACSGQTLRKPCTCSKTRDDSICSSERAPPRVSCFIILMVEINFNSSFKCRYFRHLSAASSHEPSPDVGRSGVVRLRQLLHGQRKQQPTATATAKR